MLALTVIALNGLGTISPGKEKTATRLLPLLFFLANFNGHGKVAHNI